MNPQPAASSAPPPPAVIARMVTAYQLSFCVAAAARLGVADAIGSTARSVEELGRTVGAHAPSLYRLLRALAAEGVFTETEPGRFANTPLSDVLEKDHPMSMHGFATLPQMMHMHAWPEILHSVTTGGTAMKKVFDAEVFERVAADPELGADFDQSVPAGGDVYMMKWILHDWDDERAVAILKNTRAAMSPGARLLVFEAVIPLGDAPSPGKMMDRRR